MKKTFERLIEQEKCLHLPTTRTDLTVLDALLHHDFYEFCRSGTITNKVKTVKELSAVSNGSPIFSENYACHLVDEKTVLMTYISYQIEDEVRIKLTHRSSIWVEVSHDQWQLRFHQGTPVNDRKLKVNSVNFV